MAKSVLVCMSGGVDSTVAALLLKRQGFEVAGLTFWLWSFDSAPGFHGATKCCSLDSAALAARELDISHEVIDASDAFQRFVLDDFVARVRRGETPNPCGNCNRYVRFRLALEYAQRNGFDAIATGHHARVTSDHGEPHLLRGADAHKDQTYFLYGLQRDVLSHLLLPIGELPKTRVFSLARDAGLTAAVLPESQDLCFADSGDVSFLFTDRDYSAGPILDGAGREIGQHHGLPRYTIGQRRGLGIASSRPLFVTDIDPHRNAVIVGDESELRRDSLTAAEAVYASGRPPESIAPIEAKIRYRSAAFRTAYEASSTSSFRLAFSCPQRAVTPGQLAVLYEKDRLLGGGIIARR